MGVDFSKLTSKRNFTLSIHPVATDSMAHYPYNPGIEAAMTFISKYGDVVNMSSRYGSMIAVPRRFAPSTGTDLRIVRPVPVLPCKLKPRDEDQERVIREVLELLHAGVDHCLEAPTGFGKTVCSVIIAMAFGQRTLIVVPKKDLMDSWRTTLIAAGVPEEEIGIAQAENLKYKGCRFVIGMIHSLSIEGKYDDDFRRHFGLVIFDEVHRAAADSLQGAMQKFPARHRLGVSATPKRSDGKDLVLEGNIGPVMVRGTAIPMSPKVLIKETGWTIPDYCKNFGPGQMAIVNKAIGYATARNKLIADFVADCVEAGRHPIVMSDSLAHLDKLHIAIGQRVPGEHIGRYVGGLSKMELQMGAHRKVVLATYGMCAEGTDFPHWDTLVPATPRKDQKQINGRVLRKKEGKKEPIILDLVDNHSIFRAYHNNRLKQYHDVAATIIKLRAA